MEFLFSHRWAILIAWLIVINVISILITIHDKRSAQKGRWRVRENTLLLLGALGGAHWDADYHEENPSQNQTHEVYGRASPNSFGAGSAAALFHVEMGILKGGGCDGKSSLPGGAAGCRRHSV